MERGLFLSRGRALPKGATRVAISRCFRRFESVRSTNAPPPIYYSLVPCLDTVKWVGGTNLALPLSRWVTPILCGKTVALLLVSHMLWATEQP